MTSRYVPPSKRKSVHIVRSQDYLTQKLDNVTILNLDEYLRSNNLYTNFNQKEYDNFKSFQKSVFEQLADEVDKNTGEIIKYHVHNEEYKTQLQEIFNEYKASYIDGFKPTKDKPYPFFMEDLNSKSDKPYKEFEEQNGITTKIEDQDDKQFLDTLGKRIEGLKQCTKTEGYRDISVDYFKNEYEREKDNYEQITKKVSTSKEELKQDIDKHCKLIDYSSSMVRQKNNITNEKELNLIMDRLKKFYEKNLKEKIYAKTFLPETCWNENGEIDYDIIQGIIKQTSVDGRHFAQYVYGFFSNEQLKEIRDLELPLYIIGGILPILDYKVSCSPLVIWSLLSNMLKTKCSTYNSNPLCFLRLYLPVLDTLINRLSFEDNLSYIPVNRDTNNIQEIYEIQTHNKLLNLFDNDLSKNSEFVGIISIKYIYNKTKFLESHKPEYRIWYLYVFKNNKTDKDDETRVNTMTGIRDELFCVSQDLYYINKGGLFKRDNVTYYELLFFIELCKKNNIFFYKTKYNPTLLFLSLDDNLKDNQFLSELEITKVDLKIYRYINKKTYLTLEYGLNMTGGFKLLKYKLNLSNNEKILYFNKNLISEYVIKSKVLLNKALNLSYFTDNIKDNYISTDKRILLNTIQHLYEYLLVNYDESYLGYKFNNNDIIITKYKPLGLNFYHIHELFYKYNIFKNFNYDTDTILTLGTNISFIETIKFNNYKIKNIKNILTLQQNIYKNDDLEKWNNYIKNVENIYNIENIKFNDSIYNLINFDFINSNKNNYKIIYYSVLTFYLNVFRYENYYTIPVRFVGILFMLKNLKLNGTFIFNINYLEYKFEADMILIISKYFEKYDLSKPEIHNEYKRSGINLIFENFKGINNNEYLELLKILETIKKLYPEEGKEFNIYDKDIRHELRITKPIVKIPSVIPKQIIGFLDTNINDKIYDKIKEFTEEINFKKCLFIQKMINILSSPENIKIMNNTKLPTSDQIMSSIIYCRKYNIPFNDKYTENKLNNITSKTILNDMYGLQEPILAKFKTPFQTYITNKIILNPKLKYSNKSKSNSHTHSIFKTLHSSHSFRTKRNTKIQQNKYKHKRTKKQDSIGDSFFNDLFKTKSTKSSKSSYTSTSRTKLTSRTNSLFKRQNVSLDDALFDSNNSIVQVGRMIDSRKDFTKANPNEYYDNFKEQFRYYRTKGKDKQNNLNLVVQNILGDNSISQAWLKMYEIISECNIIPLNKSGTFKSFHYCEAPGTFINCLNNYIYTKSKFDKFEWMAQSLHPRLAKIKDAYGIIKRHPKNWDWGKDGTGDITNPNNIIHYSKIIKLFNMDTPHNTPNNKPHTTPNNIPFLITADAGLEPEDPKYKMVAYSSYVAILYTLPIHGTMIYKIKDTPLDLPLIWNLIYITYTNFKEMYVFKPVQNSQSREFYIIAKEYLGTDAKVLDYLIKQIDKFNKTTYEPPNTDLFDDMYPEEFVVQMKTIYEKLAANYVNSIERIIYYVDNKELIGQDYVKHIKNYIEEKNEDWIRKYKIKRLERNKIL